MRSVCLTRIQNRIAIVARFFLWFGCITKKALKPSSRSCCKSKSTEEATAPVDYVKTPYFKYDWEVKRDDWN
jgi:hypothetical protein